MGGRRAALIEIGGSHDECLYSQLLFLKAGGYDVTLICSEDLRRQVSGFDTGEERLFFDLTTGGEWQQLRTLRTIRKEIINRGIQTIIFNSAHGRQVRNLALMPFPAGTKKFGTLHGINKLRKSATQWAISRRVPNYFLLNDYLVNNLKLVPHNKGIKFQAYYPIYFPDFEISPIHKPAGEIWIAIPGQVEQARRDYKRLIQAFAALNAKPDYRFLLLGRSDHRNGEGAAIKKLCADLGVTAFFRFWDGFLENHVFHAYLKACDVVMPLIHADNNGFEKYLIYQITGGYNLAFAYQKPLFMLDDFANYEDFRENAVFYNLNNFPEALSDLPKKLKEINGQIYQNPKWLFQYQAERYLQFLKQD